LAAEFFEPEEAQLAAQGITNEVAPGSAGLAAEPVQEFLKIGIQSYRYH
jgi:hypothetical protein